MADCFWLVCVESGLFYQLWNFSITGYRLIWTYSTLTGFCTKSVIGQIYFYESFKCLDQFYTQFHTSMTRVLTVDTTIYSFLQLCEAAFDKRSRIFSELSKTFQKGDNLKNIQ